MPQGSLFKTTSDPNSVKGVVERITYRNPENNYTVLKLDTPDGHELLTVVGYCLPFTVGANVIIHGDYTEHPKFGRQLQATGASEVEPDTEDAILKYLASGLIPGVGPGTAQKLVAVFGKETMQILYNDPDQLERVPGIGQNKVRKIKDAISERRHRIETERFFVEHNITGALLNRIFEEFGNNAITEVRKDPYQLAHSVKGIGFRTADGIALNMGFELDSPHRIRAGVFYAVEKAREDGHLYLTAPELSAKTRELLDLDSSVDLHDAVYELIDQKLLVMEEHEPFALFYLARLHEAECFVARFLAERASPYPSPLIEESIAEQALQHAGDALGISFSPEQQLAVKKACTFPLLCVTGGPGCGKTTVIRAIVATFLHAGKTIALAAPTGKAAQRMSEVCQHPASTIHRLLKYNPALQRFTFGANNPLRVEVDGVEVPHEVDLVIIDEASMIDISLAKQLFAAIPQHATLVLVGDQDQLPSVGPGRVFGDILSLAELPVIALSKLFRRAEESRITTTAHLINAGLPPEIPEPDGTSSSDAYFIDRRNPEDAARIVEKLISEQVPKKFGISAPEIQILTPTNRGPLGTLELNRRIQSSLNPRNNPNDVLHLSTGEFRVGDRVCQRVNNYKLGTYGVFNGDLGTVVEVDTDKQEIVVEVWDGRLVRYDKSLIKQLSLSYAMTIHRSQGSEMPCVIMCLHESHFTLLERQLLYTGLTRAKKLLLIVGSRRALQLACQRTTSSRRNSQLAARIRDLLPQ